MAELTLVLVPHLAGASAGHPAVEAATRELYADGSETLGVKTSLVGHPPEDGAKGALQDLTFAISAPGAIAGLVRVFRLWLARDRRRSIDVTIARPGAESTKLHVSGDSVSLEALQQVVDSALRAERDKDPTASDDA